MSAAEIEVVLNANGHTYSVSEVEYLKKLYEEYALEYFWKFQWTICVHKSLQVSILLFLVSY